MIKEYEKQERFINFIAERNDITTEEAREIVSGPYEEVKELLKEFDKFEKTGKLLKCEEAQQEAIFKNAISLEW